MSRALLYSEYAPMIPEWRKWLRSIKSHRAAKEFAQADAIRDTILSCDSGLKITVEKSGKVSLWHFPNPPFSDHLHFCNYGEFITNSEE